MKIALLGDVALFGRFCLNNDKNILSYFNDIRRKLKGYDIVVANLETPFTDGHKTKGSKSAHIGSDYINIEILKYLRITHVNLANNHIYDYGNDSYELTKNILNKNGIDYFGIESKQCHVKTNNSKVALHGYCSYNTNPQKITFDHSTGVNGLDLDNIKKNMMNNIEQGYFNIVSIHSGVEHINYPSRDDIDVSSCLSDGTPYVYYGHHPHVIQPVMMKNKSLIAFSLGNFCFSDVYTNKSKEPLIKLTENNKTGLVLTVEIIDNSISKYTCIPIYLNDTKMEIGCTDVLSKIEEYNSALQMPDDEYYMMRENLIRAYAEERKKSRDFNWYIKRLNFNSVRLIANKIKNKRKYKLHVKSKIY